MQPAPAPVCVMRGSSEVQAVCFHPFLPLLYAGDAEGMLSTWDTTDQRMLKQTRLYDRTSGVLSLAVSGAELLLSQGREGRLMLWPLGEDGRLGRQPLAAIVTLQYTFCRAVLAGQHCYHSSRGGEHQQADSLPLTVAAVGQDAAAVSLYRLQPLGPSAAPEGPEPSYDLDQVAALEQPGGSSSHGMCMCMHLFAWPQPGRPDQPRLRLASGHEDGSLLVWDCSTGSCLASLRLFKEPAMALAASGSGPGILVSSASTAMALLLFDVGGSSLSLAKRMALDKAGCDQVALRADERLAAAACWSGLVQVFHARKGRALASLQYHTAAATSVAFHPKTHMLASASRDGCIACWSLYNEP